MSTVTNDIFPNYIRYGDRPPRSFYGDVPIYGFGWMVKAVNSGELPRSFEELSEDFIDPKWREYKCRPDERNLDRYGLMIPAVWQYGPDHILLQLAQNTPQAIRLLHTRKGLELIVGQAVRVLGLEKLALDKKVFDPYDNLIWARWRPQTSNWPRDINFPCIAEQINPSFLDPDPERPREIEGTVPQEILRLIRG
ncbi:hypothetical protein NMY22_g10406 [Coprinellus aureogranulatus]|nr:hypothetical protein NMY22_g10406 [Coprinellus aureogranulatus]